MSGFRQGKRYDAKERKQCMEIIIDSIKNMSGKFNACKKAGVGYDTFLKWQRRYNDFAIAVEEANTFSDAQGKDFALACIFKNMEKYWQAAAWYLERKYKDEYAQKVNNEHSGGMDLNHKMNIDEKLNQLTIEELRNIAKLPDT